MKRFLITLSMLLAWCVCEAGDVRLVGPGSHSLQRRRIALLTQSTGQSTNIPFPFLVVTNATDRIGMSIKGTGTLAIVWGDGTTSSVALSASSYNLSNIYASSAVRTISMTGWVTSINSYGSVAIGGAASSAFGGDISTMHSLTNVDIEGSNHVGGDISKLWRLVGAQITGANAVYGDVSGLTNLGLAYFEGNNTITGTLPYSVTKAYLRGSNGITGLARWATNSASAYYLSHSHTALNQSEVDGVLFGFNANSNTAKASSAERMISLNASSDASPSTAGSNVAAALRLTVSAPGSLTWTVNTK